MVRNEVLPRGLDELDRLLTPADERSFAKTHWEPFLQVVQFLIDRKAEQLSNEFYTQEREGGDHREDDEGSTTTLEDKKTEDVEEGKQNNEMTEGMRALHSSSFVGEAVVPRDASLLYKIMNYEQAEPFHFAKLIKSFFRNCDHTPDFLLLFQLLLEFAAAHGGAAALRNDDEAEPARAIKANRRPVSAPVHDDRGLRMALPDLLSSGEDRGGDTTSTRAHQNRRTESNDLRFLSLISILIPIWDDLAEFSDEVFQKVIVSAPQPQPAGKTTTTDTIAMTQHNTGQQETTNPEDEHPAPTSLDTSPRLRGMYLGLTGRFLQRQTRQIRVYFPMSFGNWFDHEFQVSLVRAGAEDSQQVSGIIIDDKVKRERKILDRLRSRTAKTDTGVPATSSGAITEEGEGETLPAGLTSEHIQYFFRVPVFTTSSSSRRADTESNKAEQNNYSDAPHDDDHDNPKAEELQLLLHREHAELFQQWHPIAQVTLFYWFLKHCLAVLEKDAMLPMGAFSQTYARLEDWHQSGINYEKLSDVLETEIGYWRSLFPNRVNAAPFQFLRLMGDRKKFLDIWRFLAKFGTSNFVWGRYLKSGRNKESQSTADDSKTSKSTSGRPSSSSAPSTVADEDEAGRSDDVHPPGLDFRLLPSEASSVQLQRAWWPQTIGEICEFLYDTALAVQAEVMYKIHDPDRFHSAYHRIAIDQPIRWEKEIRRVAEEQTKKVDKKPKAKSEIAVLAQHQDQEQGEPTLQAATDGLISALRQLGIDVGFVQRQIGGLATTAIQAGTEELRLNDDSSNEQISSEYVMDFAALNHTVRLPYTAPLFDYFLNEEIQREHRMGLAAAEAGDITSPVEVTSSEEDLHGDRSRMEENGQEASNDASRNDIDSDQMTDAEIAGTYPTCGEAIGQMIVPLSDNLDPLTRFRRFFQQRLDRVVLADTLWRSYYDTAAGAMHRVAQVLLTSKRPFDLWDDCDPAQSLTRKFLNYAQDQMDSVLSRIFQLAFPREEDGERMSETADHDVDSEMKSKSKVHTNAFSDIKQKHFYVDVGVGFAGVEHYARFLRTFRSPEWTGIMLDVGHANSAIGYHPEMLSPENVVAEVFPRRQVPFDFAFLVLQIDSFSWHVLRAILQSSQRIREHRTRNEMKRRVCQVWSGISDAVRELAVSEETATREYELHEAEQFFSPPTACRSSSSGSMRNDEDERRDHDAVYYYPKVIQIEHIHSYFWPDHMMPPGLNLIPRYKRAEPANAGEAYRRLLQMYGEADHEEQEETGQAARGGPAAEASPSVDSESDRKKNKPEDEDKDEEALALTFTVANDYESRVATQIHGYFKAFIATAAAIKQLGNAFGYDVIYFGWWNMVLVDRLHTSDLVPTKGKKGAAGRKNVAATGSRPASGLQGKQDPYDSQKLAQSLWEVNEVEAGSVAGSNNFAPGSEEQVESQMNSRERKGTSTKNSEASSEIDEKKGNILEEITSEAIISSADPLNYFDPEKIAANIRGRLPELPPEAEERVQRRRKTPRLHHRFRHKNDLQTLCELYSKRTHRHYWQAPLTFFLTKNLCTTPEGLVVGFSQEEITERYWLDFLFNTKKTAFQSAPSASLSRHEQILQALIRDPKITF
ncbi:unnamed protein product [Amoebophrya sp. A120]|nr:unnamed protein product [Amoebophrya sp. A120]|eukprot:GSA120T00002294001.1